MRLRIIRKFLDVDVLVREEGLESNNSKDRVCYSTSGY